MSNATLAPIQAVTEVETVQPEVVTGNGASEFLAIVAANVKPEFAPGRVNAGRQASFDAVAGWNARGGVA
jgi:hypothetical protein